MERCLLRRIAPYVKNYVTTKERGAFKKSFKLPAGAKRPIAVLSKSGISFQDNVEDVAAYQLQYWGEIDSAGNVEIPRVKADTYRLTTYADGIFGNYIKDNIRVTARKTTKTSIMPYLMRCMHVMKKIKIKKTKASATWNEESARIEVWRLGTPDKSPGEFRHGSALDRTHPLQPREYCIYWGAYDFPTDLPDGVNFTAGKSETTRDFNTVHWSVFGPTHNRNEPYTRNINNWTINFDLTARDLKKAKTTTLIIQLDGAETAARNTDVFSSTELYLNLPHATFVNDQVSGLSFVIPYYHTSSCVVRSACSQLLPGSGEADVPNVVVKGQKQ